MTNRFFTKLRRLVGATLVLVSVTGCGGQIKEFVKGARPPTENQPDETPPVVVAGQTSLKISPGRMVGSATDGAIKATVTTTNLLLPAGDVSVRLTINRSTSPPSN